MTTYDNAPPPPDWSPEPHPSPFDPPPREDDPILPPNIELGRE